MGFGGLIGLRHDPSPFFDFDTMLAMEILHQYLTRLFRLTQKKSLYLSIPAHGLTPLGSKLSLGSVAQFLVDTAGFRVSPTADTFHVFLILHEFLFITFTFLALKLSI